MNGMAAGAKQSEFAFELTGGALCLDFANTVYDRPVAAQRRDHVSTYSDLVDWSRQVGLVSLKEAMDLRRRGELDPVGGEAVVVDAQRVREAIYAIFSAVAAGREPPPGELDTLNSFVLEAWRHLRIQPVRTGFELVWSFGPDEVLRRLLWPVARSAAELLTSDRIKNVRECAADSCAWLFLDNSRSQKRRWCDMKICGNRAKARRFSQRAKARKRSAEKNDRSRS